MIRIESVVWRAGPFRLDLSFTVQTGEYFVIMGPTGSGKTTAVECIAGLRTPQSGRIEINGRDVTRAEPRQRNIGYVPQDYALFANRTVAGNLAFGPEVRRWPRHQCERVVRDAARPVGIEHLLARRIAGLSGGERQRVALARALTIRPELLILDEPVSALDECTREAVCRELRDLQRSLGVPVIHVCHSFEEARLVGDRVGLVIAGRMVQQGTPDDLVRAPATPEAARLLRLGNLFTGSAETRGGAGTVRVGGIELSTPPASGAVSFMVRAEQIAMVTPGVAPCWNRVSGRIAEIANGGLVSRLRLDGPIPLQFYLLAREVTRQGLKSGIEVTVAFPPDAVHLFPQN